MKKGRAKRNKLVIIVGAVVLMLSWHLKLTPNKFNNFTDVMSASLSFSALATAMFFSCFSLIPAFSNSKFIIALKQLGTDKKIMDRLLISTFIFFISSLLSFIELFFSATDSSIVTQVITALWLSFTVMGFFNTFYILYIILKAFDYYSGES